MFGYVIANLEGLTQAQKDRYKGCYCGLCRVLKQRHGLSGRLTLTYDMTFLVLLLSALAYVPVSAALTFCYEQTRSIWPPVFFHMCINALSLTVLAG